MKKLYRKVITAYVMAENEADAEYVHIDQYACDVVITEAKTVSRLWKNAIPFGSDDDLTCEQVLAKQGEGEE